VRAYGVNQSFARQFQGVLGILDLGCKRLRGITPELHMAHLVDYRGHPRYYPRVVSAELVEANPQHALVRYAVGVSVLSPSAST
jgi:hypothetical protein